MKSKFEHYGQKLKSNNLFIFLGIYFLYFRYFGFTPYEQKFNKAGDFGNLQRSLAVYMPENKDTWHRLAKRKQLDESAFNYATWDFIGE
jgi:hypothetical protein